MRVAYLSNSAVPSRSANSVHVMKMCGAFAALGHEVVLATRDEPDSMERGVVDVFRHYGVAETFENVRLPWPRWPGRGYAYGARAGWLARARRADLVYCRNLVGCGVAIAAGLQAVLEVHAPLLDSGGRVADLMFRRIIRSPRLLGVVTITHALADRLRADHGPGMPEPIVAPDAADPMPTDVRPAALPGPGRFRVGYVGNLHAGKGLELVERLAAICDWADFHIVGGYDADVAHWKARMGSLGNVTFHGYHDSGAVSAFLAAFDAVLLPNQREMKGGIGAWTSPLKMFEYMSAGVPMIASSLPVLQEILQDGTHARLCPPDDANAWARALRALRDDPQSAREMAARAHASFVARHTWTARARQVLAAIPTTPASAGRSVRTETGPAGR